MLPLDMAGYDRYMPRCEADAAHERLLRLQASLSRTWAARGGGLLDLCATGTIMCRFVGMAVGTAYEENSNASVLSGAWR